MIGYIYDIETRKIATKISNITSRNDTTIKGDGVAIIGTGQYIITNEEYNVGDILPIEIDDKRLEIAVLTTY
jgi:hypothetical protein